MRSRTSDSQSHSRNNPGFDPSISDILESEADEAVLNKVHKKIQSNLPINLKVLTDHSNGGARLGSFDP
jgi:hypothetical protein